MAERNWKRDLLAAKIDLEQTKLNVKASELKLIDLADEINRTEGAIEAYKAAVIRKEQELTELESKKPKES